MSKDLKILEFDIEILSVPYTIGVSRNLESDDFFIVPHLKKRTTINRTKSDLNFAYDPLGFLARVNIIGNGICAN